ncbi:unnamed protein product [Urochloa humidicola]
MISIQRSDNGASPKKKEVIYPSKQTIRSSREQRGLQGKSQQSKRHLSRKRRERPARASFPRVAVGRSGRSCPEKPELGKKKKKKKPAEARGEMLILDLAIWIIPVTLVLVPCRRLVARLQELEQCIMRPRSPPPDSWAWGRVGGLHTMSIMM